MAPTEKGPSGGAGDGSSGPPRRPTPHRGLLGSAAARTGKVAMVPVNAAARSPLAHEARRKAEEAVLDFLESPEAEQAVTRLLEGPLPDAVGRSLTESHVVERIVESDAFARAVEDALEGPAVRAALARTGSSIVEETIAALCARLALADDAVEATARRLLRRPQRARGAARGGSRQPRRRVRRRHPARAPGIPRRSRGRHARRRPCRRHPDSTRGRPRERPAGCSPSAATSCSSGRRSGGRPP